MIFQFFFFKLWESTVMNLVVFRIRILPSNASGVGSSKLRPWSLIRAKNDKFGVYGIGLQQYVNNDKLLTYRIAFTLQVIMSKRSGKINCVPNSTKQRCGSMTF